MNELTIFKNEQFGEIRTIEENGKVLFCGSDVAKALGYSSPKDAITAHCKGAVKRRLLTKGGEQDVKFIPEGDVYRLITHSKLPTAEKFESWVFDEVLPAKHKTTNNALREDVLNINETQVQVFKNENFGSIRTVEIDGEIWFVGKDVAAALGYGNPRQALSTNVDADDKVVHPMDTPGGIQEMTLINESGLYSLILFSKLPKAKEFKHWVTSEVLPAIRKTGGYVANEDMFIEHYLPDVDDSVKQLFRASLKTIDNLNGKITTLNRKIESDKPKTEFYDDVADTEGLIDMGKLSKVLAKNGIIIVRNRLFALLRANRYLRDNNEPYQKFVDAGYFVLREYTYYKHNEPQIGCKTYITGKGQQYFVKKIQELLTVSA